MRSLDALDALKGIQFVGVEPYPPFVTDFGEYFPTHRAILADVGYEIASGVEIPHPDGVEGVGTVDGYALVRAVRKP